MAKAGTARVPIRGPRLLDKLMVKPTDDVSVLETVIRAMPFLAFVALMFFTLPSRNLSSFEHGGLLILQLALGGASIAAWIRRSPKSRNR